MLTQVYWVRTAFTLEEEQFEKGASTSLYNVAKRLSEYNQSVMPSNNPVKQLSSNYFIVNVNDVIDANLLEFYLKEEFGKRNISADFDYAIYDCSTDEMVYGDYISLNENADAPENSKLQKYDEFNYYFGVRFPQRAAFITSKMGIWVFSSIILLVIIIFFSATIFIILRQKRLSEVQKDFINNMTHEFKTPLSTIGISADVLLNQNITEQPERLKKYANLIKSEASRLNDQVLRVLQMARIDKEKQKLEFKKLEIVPLLQDVVSSAIEKARKKGGNIELMTSTSPEIVADEVHLSNIVNNLLENAIQYCQEAPSVIVSLTELKNHYLLSIRDNGIGIAPQHQKKVFDKFFRVPKGNVHDVKGFGIGLNYVQNIVQAHHWKISLESELNKGSTFNIQIPK